MRVIKLEDVLEAKQLRTDNIVELAYFISPQSHVRMASFIASEIEMKTTGKHQVPGIVVEAPQYSIALNFGDWVVEGRDGYFYGCKSSEFEKIYMVLDS